MKADLKNQIKVYKLAINDFFKISQGLNFNSLKENSTKRGNVKVKFSMEIMGI